LITLREKRRRDSREEIGEEEEEGVKKFNKEQ
jgi:hypothetical protein